jgi:hypothetical protein
MKCKNFEKRLTQKPDYVAQMLQLWRDVAVTTAGTEAARDVGAPARWANAAIEGYAAVLTELKNGGAI